MDRSTAAPGATPAPVTDIPEENLPGHHPEVEQDKPSLARLPHGTARRFAFAFEPHQLLLGLPLGITPLTSWVTVGSHDLHIRYGPWSLRTPLDNVADAEVTGPYTMLRIAGPPRLSLADRGISFATRRSSGVCIRFRDPVPGIMPLHLGLVKHPGATVTVTRPDELIRLLTERRSGRVSDLGRARRRGKRPAPAGGWDPAGPGPVRPRAAPSACGS